VMRSRDDLHADTSVDEGRRLVKVSSARQPAAVPPGGFSTVDLLSSSLSAITLLVSPAR